MQHIGKLLPNSETSQAALVLSPRLWKALSEEEKRIVEYKYSDRMVFELTPEQLLKNTAEAVQRIHIITGWNVPDDKTYTKILIEELALKLSEAFPRLNFKEIIYAFRKNGIGIKDWGKNMNLELICQVLAHYTSERSAISEAEERESGKPVQRIYTDEEIKNEYRRDVEAFYQRLIKSPSAMEEQLPDYFKEILVQDKFIHPDSDYLMGFFLDCLDQRLPNIYIKSNE